MPIPLGKHLLIGLLGLGLFTATAAAAEAPNVLFIFTDDSGYRDFGFQGSERFKTPQMDRLAAEGVVCTNGYVSASVCGPSRAGLLTGRYQQRFGYFMNPKAHRGLPTSESTFADAMRAQGYRTGIIGKWHMGLKPDEHPNRRGFDYFYGFLGGYRSYFPWKPSDEKGKRPVYKMMHNDRFLDESKMDFYTTDLFTDKAIEFMQASRAKDKPFFLFLSHNATHGPMHALPQDLTKYRHLEDEKHHKLGGMLAALDRSTGRLLDYLESTGLREKTLVVWLNDNGGVPELKTSNWPLRGYKGHEWEGGIRVPFVLSMPGTLPTGSTYDQPVISLDLFPTFVTLAGGDPSANPKPLDGVDLIPYLAGERTDAPHEALFWQRKNAAVRVGDWKLMEWNTKNGEYTLCNLAEDIGEKNNVIDDHPEKAQDLKARLKAWQAEHAPRM